MNDISAIKVGVQGLVSAVRVMVPGPQGRGPDELVLAQLMLEIVNLSTQMSFIGATSYRVADSFKDTTALDLVRSQNLDTSEVGTIKPGILAPIPIPHDEGTAIGNMTANGGNEAAFNGAASQAAAESAFSLGTSAFVGKIFDTPRRISRVTIRGSSDYGLDGGPGSGRMTFTIYGMVGNGSPVLLGSAGGMTDGPNAEVIIDSSDAATLFDRVDIVVGSQLGGCCIAQAILEQPGGIAPMTAWSKIFTDITFAPKKMKSVIIADLPSSAQVNQDLIMAFSRDGGDHLTQSTLTLRTSASSTRHIFESDEVSMLDQPEAMEPCWQITTSGLMVPVRAAVLYAVA